MLNLMTTEDYTGVWEGVAPSSVYNYELDVDFEPGGIVRVFEQRTSFETNVTEVFIAEGRYTVGGGGWLEDFLVWEEGGGIFHTYTVAGAAPGDLELQGAFGVYYRMTKVSGS